MAIAEISHSYRQRARSLLAVNQAIHQIINVLQATNQWDNTAVLFTSDNGFYHGEHRIPQGKIRAYEEALRVPLVIRVPGMPGGRINRDLVVNVDLAPTIVELAQVAPGHVMDGKSLVPLLEANANAPWRTAFLIESKGVSGFEGSNLKGVRSGQWKYLEHNSGERELYDMQNDPFERNSLHNSPAHQSVIQTLQQTLNTMKTCAGATCWQ